MGPRISICGARLRTAWTSSASGTGVSHERTSSMNRQQSGDNLSETGRWSTIAAALRSFRHLSLHQPSVVAATVEMQHRAIGVAQAEHDGSSDDLVTYATPACAVGDAGHGALGRITGKVTGSEPVASHSANVISHSRSSGRSSARLGGKIPTRVRRTVSLYCREQQRVTRTFLDALLVGLGASLLKGGRLCRARSPREACY